MSKTIKGFKDFILRGNVVDLAVAVVIGAAFSGVVKAFTEGILQPLLAAIGSGKPDKGGLDFYLRSGNPQTKVQINELITVLINFVITAAVIYFFVVVPINMLLERRRRGQEPEPSAPPEDIVLLQEIRDLLRERPLDTRSGPADSRPQA